MFLAHSLPLFLVIATAAGPIDREAEAKRLVDLMARGEFAAAVATFDDTMKTALPEAKLREAWASISAQAGAFQKQESARSETVGGHDVVVVTCRFERAALDARIAFDPNGRVAGLFFAPAAPAQKWEPPAYCRAGSFVEREVTVGAGEWALPGTLSVPAGPGPHPAVVLVHGSGPHDRDETIGPQKPFSDLACGLASRGVAVLRYEKRTRQHAAKLTGTSVPFTVKEEAIDDALAAAKLLREAAGASIDPKRVFVLGHSLGGMLVPRIGREAPALAGLIALAGNSRPLEELILEQVAYLTSLGTVPASETVKIRALVDRVKALGPAQAASAEPLMGAPASYWLDLRAYRPAEVARTLKQPMLILQGERDYQVTMADFKIWQETLGARGGVTFKSYPDLNHLFMTGQGKSTLAEYQQPGHIAEAVVQDIAAWIRR